MTDYLNKIIGEIETHSVEGIKECFANELDPNVYFNNEPLKCGADINAKAGFDENGFGGQTPIFHTVNQILNHSIEMLNFLLSKSAELKNTVAGLIWGKGYEWETLIPSVNPISYAMMGLLPQMHRNEIEISKIVSLLLKAAYGVDYSASNVPNKYLKH